MNPTPAATEDSEDINKGDLNRVRTLQGVRLYRPNEACGYFFSLYHDTSGSGGSDLEMKMKLLHGTEPVRYSEWRPLSIDIKDLNKEGWAYVGEKINLVGLTPGVYELHVSVKNNKETVERIATLGIE